MEKIINIPLKVYLKENPNYIKCSKYDYYSIPPPKLEKGKELNKNNISTPIRAELTPTEAFTIITKLHLPEPSRYDSNFPSYLNESIVRERIENEYARLVEEQRGYTPGRYKVLEEDKILILRNLFLLKEELLGIE